MRGYELFKIRFEGGLAEQGKLDFYDFSRSQYATSRMITTIEHFRRTGAVPDRITRKINVGTLIEAPRRECFETSFWVPVLQNAIGGLAAIGVAGFSKILFDNIAHNTSINDKDTGDVLSIANTKLLFYNRKLNKTTDDYEDSGRLKEIVENRKFQSIDALNLLNWIKNHEIGHLQRLGYTIAQIDEKIKMYAIEVEREVGISKEKEIKLDRLELNELSNKVRALIPDVALPLRSSAENVTFSVGSAEKETRIIYLNEQRIKEITKVTDSEVSVEVVCRIKQYDRDTCFGTLQSSRYSRNMNFSTSYSHREILKQKIIRALEKDNVTAIITEIMSQDNIVKRVIIEDVSDKVT